MSETYEKTRIVNAYVGRSHEAPRVDVYPDWFGYQRPAVARFYVHEDGRREPVRDAGGGYDAPPSWVVQEREDRARRLREAKEDRAFKALEVLASNGCDLPALSDEDLQALHQTPSPRGPAPSGGPSERRGQQDLVRSGACLPKDRAEETTRVLTEAGVVFGKDQDDMFQEVTLPPGRSIMHTDHPLWSNLLDERGRVRATCFYKAAFYDRSASLSLRPRFTVRCEMGARDPDGENFRAPHRGVVLDGGRIIHVTALVESDDIRLNLGKFSADKARGLATAWLQEKYPDFRNPGAYWDLP